MWGRVPRRWMPAPPWPCRCCKDQFFVGLFDQDLEELALDFQTGLMDVGLDLVGEMLVLGRHGQGHLQRHVERECLTVPVDGGDGDGSLKAVGRAHGVSPYWNYGGASCVLFDRSGGKSHYPGAESRRKTLLLYRASPLLSRTNIEVEDFHLTRGTDQPTLRDQGRSVVRRP